ncbi:MAG: ammonium transporter [Candidatus Anammoxibacter sp.]
MRRFSFLSIFIFAMIMIASPLVWADDGGMNSGDNAWMLMSSALVLLMTPGLAFFYGGMSSVKNVLNMIMMSLACILIVSVQWVFWGYSIAFGPDVWHFFGNLSLAGLHGITPDSLSGSIPEYTFVMFQMTFAIITVALISGAAEGRMKFSTWLIFIPVWATLVYDPICHWVWAEGGWAFNMGIMDYAGGTVVHINSAAAALALCIMLGKRKTNNIKPPCNLPMVMLGTGLLWFGWFGFNAGSTLVSGGSTAFAFLITNTACATAAFTWMICEWIATGRPTLLGACSGAVAGLVVITPACGFVGPLGAVQMGLMGGIGCFFGATKLKQAFGYDDALDVVGVHGVGGTIGAFAVGLYSTPLVGADAGFFIGWDGAGIALLGKQCIGFLAAWGYSFGVTMIILLILKGIMGLRTTEEEENAGLDISLHKEMSYHLELESTGSIKDT